MRGAPLQGHAAQVQSESRRVGRRDDAHLRSELGAAFNRRSAKQRQQVGRRERLQAAVVAARGRPQREELPQALARLADTESHQLLQAQLDGALLAACACCTVGKTVSVNPPHHLFTVSVNPPPH